MEESLRKKVALTSENAGAVLNYGQRLYALGRITDENGADLLSEDGETYADGYLPRHKPDQCMFLRLKS